MVESSCANTCGESPTWLLQHFDQGADLLLIDCRPHGDYAKGHIEGAINISVSSLMLRRLKKGNVPFRNFISNDDGKRRFERRKESERVVIYDERSSDPGSNNILDFLLAKLREDNLVSFLDGGFRQFEESYPHLCQCAGAEQMENAVLSLANLALVEDDRDTNARLSRDSNNNKRSNENAKDLLFRAESNGPIEIIPRLYLGNRKDSSNLTALKRASITHVVNVTRDLSNEFEHLAGFRYLNIPVQDDSEGNILELFPLAYEFIDSALECGASVLVHCLGGISRSSTIVIAFIMCKLGYSLNDAYDIVKSKKSNIAPNFNFMGQLLDFERMRTPATAHAPTSPLTGESCSPGSLSLASTLSLSTCSSNSLCDSC